MCLTICCCLSTEGQRLLGEPGGEPACEGSTGIAGRSSPPFKLCPHFQRASKTDNWANDRRQGRKFARDL